MTKTSQADPESLQRAAGNARCRALLYVDDNNLRACLLELACCYEDPADTIERVRATRGAEEG